MISLSVPVFIVFTTVVWITAGLIVLFAIATAWQGHLALSMGLSGGAAAIFHIPILAMFTGWIKLAFERQDQLLESSIGKVVSAISLVFAMTGMVPFLAIFGFSAIVCLIVYAISRVFN